MAIRFDKKFNNEIQKIVKAYNSKITRLSKKGGYILPEKFTAEAVKSLKETSTTRTYLRRRLKDLEIFTARGGEKIIKVGKTSIPKYLITNIKRYQRLLKLQTTRKLREYETRKPKTTTGEEPFTFSQYGTQEYLTLKAKRDILATKDLSKLSLKEQQNYLNKLIANTKTKDLNIWKNNYLSILEDTALSYGYDPDKLDVIVNRLNRLSSSDFDDLTFINRNIQAILYSYKVLEDVNTAGELNDISDDVIRNLDSIYENLDEILSDYE